MKTDNLEKQVKLLSILVDGCKKHPAYRAIRLATGRCKPCVDMWQARQGLEELKNDPQPNHRHIPNPVQPDGLG